MSTGALGQVGKQGNCRQWVILLHPVTCRAAAVAHLDVGRTEACDNVTQLDGSPDLHRHQVR